MKWLFLILPSEGQRSHTIHGSPSAWRSKSEIPSSNDIPPGFQSTGNIIDSAADGADYYVYGPDHDYMVCIKFKDLRILD